MSCNRTHRSHALYCVTQTRIGVLSNIWENYMQKQIISSRLRKHQKLVVVFVGQFILRQVHIIVMNFPKQ